MSWNGRKPRYTRELTHKHGRIKGSHSFWKKSYYFPRRFEFYRADFRTIRLPGAMGGPVFLAAYDIARICQVEFTPAVRHSDWAAKIKALGMILFETPEFARLRPQTQKRYCKWLDDFCFQIGGRFLPTMRYIGLVKQYRLMPRPALLREHCREFRGLLQRAANQKTHSCGYRPRPEESKPTAPPPTSWMSADTHRMLHELVVKLRQPREALSQEDKRRREMRLRLEVHTLERARALKYPKHMQVILTARAGELPRVRFAPIVKTDRLAH